MVSYRITSKRSSRSFSQDTQSNFVFFVTSLVKSFKVMSECLSSSKMFFTSERPVDGRQSPSLLGMHTALNTNSWNANMALLVWSFCAQLLWEGSAPLLADWIWSIWWKWVVFWVMVTLDWVIMEFSKLWCSDRMSCENWMTITVSRVALRSRCTCETVMSTIQMWDNYQSRQLHT